MKEPFEDRITERIKEVMVQYEPDYSPQAWEKLMKQLPVPEFWLKRLLLKYKFWVSDIAMIGVFVIVYNFASVFPAEENSAVDPLFSKTANFSASENLKEISYSENTPVLRQNISETGSSRKEENISTRPTPVLIADSLTTAGQDDLQTENAIADMTDNIEKEPVTPVLLEGKDYFYQYNITELIPMSSRVAEIPVLKSSSYEKSGKSKFQWPELNSLFTKEEGYDKFIGPNKLALFYSPEMLHTDSLETLGVSHGIGISLEGLIRSTISISAGLSYQAIDFHKTMYSEKVLQAIPNQPPDTGYIYQEIDSIGTTNGSYKYLEVPVYINFRFFESGRSQVWFGTGISSIIFLKQDYTTETYVGGISDQVSTSAKGWENFLLVASINFSLLYRYRISDRFLLHSSAQYKYQPGTLGYNSMKLNRLNLQIGLMFSFGRKQ
jgi:hypothetical protein